MERVRVAFATIQREPDRAREVIEQGVREYPEAFIAGVAYFIAEAYKGAVIAPKNIPD